MSSTRPPVRNHWFVILVVSGAMAFLFAVVFVVTMTLSLPPTDGAYGSAPFSHPLVFPVMSIVASIAGVLVTPFVYAALRNRRLSQTLPIVAGGTTAWIIAVTPFSVRWGFWGSFAALGMTLIISQRCTRRVWPVGCCAGCGYDLTGNTSGVCPECGGPA
jgi:hypothetical protein